MLDSITLSMHRRNTIGVYNTKSLIHRRFMMITRKIEDKKTNKGKPKYRSITHTP